jgi:pimeloyl-ACP methyl ester carboxylesterase
MSRYLNLIVSNLALMLCLFCYCFAQYAQADTLARRATWQVRTSPAEPIGRTLTEVLNKTPLFDAGLRVGDVVLNINGRLINDSEVWNELTDALVAEQEVAIRYKRGTEVRETKAVFKAIARESYAKHLVEYGSIYNSYGFRQRTFLTLPQDQVEDLPAVFFVQGLSCSSVEVLPNSQSNYRRMIKLLIENLDMAVMRVEKPGVGDSEGSCSESDFLTELHGYEVALEKLLADPRIDKRRVVVYGNSMGSALAPYLVNKYQLNGVVSDGTFFRTWFEHMLEIERRIQQMQGKAEADINKAMNTVYIPLYYQMLIKKKSYGDITTDSPLYKPFNYHARRHMYGRPMRYYHQLQDFDIAGEWSKVVVPVRIRYGENDWIMSKSDNRMIVDALSRNGNNDVELMIYPKLDHWSTLHDTPAHSFNGEQGEWEDNIALMLVNWINELNGV